MGEWKKATLTDLPDDPARPRRGVNSRSMRVDMNGLHIAIDQYTPYSSLEEYLRERKPLDAQTLRAWLADKEGWLSKNSILQLINDIRVPDPKLILLCCREQMHDEDTFLLRTAVYNVIQSIKPEMHQRDENGKVCLVNVWDEFICRAPAHALALFRADESSLIVAMDSWCRDGLLQQKENQEKHYTFFFLSEDQLKELALTATDAFRVYVRQAIRRTTKKPELLELLIYNLDMHREEARRQLNRGLNFRRNRRLFYEAFGLDIAGIGQSLGCLLDQLEGKFMQVRFYMKVKHGSITPQYQAEMEEINDPLMECLDNIYEAISLDQGIDIDTIVEAFVDDLKCVDDMIATYHQLRNQLIEKGLILSDGRVLG